MDDRPGSAGEQPPEYEALKGSYWQTLGTRRTWGIVAGVVLALAALGSVLALTAARPPHVDPGGEASATITPAEPTSEPTRTVPPYEPPVVPVEPVVPDAEPAVSTPARAALVAYRRDGWLCIAAEDGTGERRVVESAAGAFRLSPDGGMLTFVGADTGMLHLATVTTGSIVTVGPAAQDAPSWSPDSAWLVCATPDGRVQRMARDGTGAALLFEGSLPAVSTDGSAVVGLLPTGEVAVWRDGIVTRIAPAGPVTALASDGTTLYYGAIQPSSPSGVLRAVALTGAGDRVIVDTAMASKQITFGDLLLSADGSTLVYTETGDDAYSRMFAVPARGGGSVSLSARHDCYPLCWTADQASVLFIEGNAFQGEPTSLMRVEPTGQARRLLIAGAGR